LTDKQCHIAILLLKGNYVLQISPSVYRVYTPNVDPVYRFTSQTFLGLKKYLRKTNRNRWVIDKRIIRGLHGRSWIKKEYRKLLQLKNTTPARS
jgi:hypothetical protein